MLGRWGKARTVSLEEYEEPLGVSGRSLVRFTHVTLGGFREQGSLFGVPVKVFLGEAFLRVPLVWA